MTIWVALLHGINVGTARRIPMAALRDCLEASGFGEVETYIQSGNVVFRASGTAADHEAVIAEAVAAGFGFRPEVIVLRATALEDALDRNPFHIEAEADGTKVHLMFAREPMADGALADLAPYAEAGERAEAIGGVLYLHTPNGMARSKLAARLARWKPPLTARNARTAAAIVAMARRRRG